MQSIPEKKKNYIKSCLTFWRDERLSLRWRQGHPNTIISAAAGAYLFLLILVVVWYTPGHTALRPPPAIPEYNLEVSFDLPRGKIKGQVVIQAPPGKKLVINPGDLNLIKLEERGRRVAINLTKKGEPLVLFPQGAIHLTYEGNLNNSEDNHINEQGLLLQDMWYPWLEGFCRFKLTAMLPTGFVAISEADRIVKEEKAGQVIFHFDFPYPVYESDGISLVASNQFVTSHTTYKDIELWTYLLPKEAPLAAGYLERAKVLLEKYENLFGPFPYRRFAIVESILKASLALPTYVLLSQDGLLQNDPENSPLDHELVHQWFGCAVSPYYDRGNWSEGLVTYFSSHLQHEAKSEDWLYRRVILADFQSRVKQTKEYPLRKFSECRGAPSRAIGYGKGAMVFHMLRQEVGDQAFFVAVGQFFNNHQHAVASWTDIQQTFERVIRRNLSWFFRQWVEETGQPHITIKEVKVKKMSDGFAVDLVLWQKGRPKRLALPVTFKGVDGDQNFQVELDQREKRYSFLLGFPPQEVVIDKYYTVFRALLPAEYPPTLAPSPYIGNVARIPVNVPRGIRRLLAFF